MKKFFTVIFVFTLFLLSCGDKKESEDWPPCVDCTECNHEPFYYGSASADENEDFFDQCVYEAEHSYGCYDIDPEFDAKELFENLRKITFVLKECRQRPFGPVLCPGSIPDSISLAGIQLTGCKIDSIEYGYSWCDWRCPSFYFSIDGEKFKTLSFYQNGHSHKDDFGFGGSETGKSFNMHCEDTLCYASYEESQVIAEYKMVFDGMPDEEEENNQWRGQCNYFGEFYKNGERFTDGCTHIYCENGWLHYDESMCRAECEHLAVAKWLCNDGKTELDWCDCLQRGDIFEWVCVDRSEKDCRE